MEDDVTPDGASLRRIGEGRQAEIFEYGNGRVIKLFREGTPVASIERERIAMEAVRSAGGPAPVSRGLARVMGRDGLVMDRIDGPDMLTLLGSKPWMAWACGRILGEMHAALHEVAAPPELPTVHARFRDQINAAVTAAPEHRDLAQYVLGVLDGLPEGDRICHGDYHPANVLLAEAGPVVIDWPNAMRGDRHADVARTLLIMEIASAPPGAPAMVVRLIAVGRRIVRASYLRAYKRRASLDEALLARWRIPVAGQRMVEGIEDELPKALAIIERARARDRAAG